MTQLAFDLDKALGAMDAGIERVSMSNAEFLSLARRVAMELGIRKGEVTSDDVRRACDAAGIRPKHPNAYGAVFRDGHWEQTGEFKRSELEQGHGNLIRVWRYRYR